MGQRARLLIVTTTQYGYLTDTYMYCKHLSNVYEIIYACIDEMKSKMPVEGISVYYYLPSAKERIYQYGFARFIKDVVEDSKPDVTFVVYFPFCTLLRRYLDIATTVIDVRTGSTSHFKFSRVVRNTLMKIELNLYKHKSVISHGLAKALSIRDYFYLPPGAKKLALDERIFNTMYLCYVGIIRKNVHSMVTGYQQFYEKYCSQVPLRFIIAGKGKPEYVKRLKAEIEKSDVNASISYLGWVSSEVLPDLFAKSNIGVSFIPKTEYFNYQPPTKTFEYVLAGMACIATDTFENSQLIDNDNGILCGDTPEEFCYGLERLFSRLHTYSSSKITRTLEKYEWERIVHNYYQVIIQTVAQGGRR